LITNGINMRGSYRIDFSADSKLNFTLGYSYLDSKFKDTRSEPFSKYLISSLKHQITNTIDFQHKDFSILFATRFNERVTGASYWINDFRVSQSVKKFIFFVDAQNIFNTTYFEVGDFPLPSRWFSAGVKFVSF